MKSKFNITLAGLMILFFLSLPLFTKENNIFRVQLLGQNQLIAGSKASFRLIATNFDREKPLSGVNVSGKLITASKTEIEILSPTVTNQAGTVEFTFDVPKTAGKAELKVTASKGKTIKTLSAQLQIKEFYQIYLTTDKPLYQPNQTIYIRALVLTPTTLLPVPQKEASFVVKDPKGNKLYQYSTTTSSFGVASAKFVLGDEINLGKYTIICKVGETDEEKTVTVKNYVLPKFKIEFQSDKTYYLPGEKLIGEIKANYFFGKPVKDAKVKVTFSTFTVQKEELAVIKGVTNKEGIWNFSWALPKYLVGHPWQGGKGEIELTIEVTDTAKHQEVNYQSLLIASEPLEVNLISDPPQLVPKLPNIIYLLTSYPDGKPAICDIQLKIKEKVVKLTTDKSGFVSFKFTPTTSAPLNYTLKIKDVLGNKIEKSGKLQSTSEDKIILHPFGSIYKVGEKAKFTIFSNLSGNIYLDIINSGQTLLLKSLVVKNKSIDFALPLTPQLLGTLTVTAYKITPQGEVIGDSKKIIVEPAETLNINVALDKQVYRPGGKAIMEFYVRDSKKQPAVSVIGLDIVDESLLALAEKSPGFAELYFLLEKELLEPKYEIHGINMPALLLKPEGKNIQTVTNLLLLKATQEEKKEPFTLNIDSYKEELIILAKKLDKINNAFYKYYEKQNKYPEDIFVLVKENFLTEEDIIDPWGNYIQVQEFEKYGPSAIYSLGPDEKDKTGDEISLSNITDFLSWKELEKLDLSIWRTQDVLMLRENKLLTTGVEAIKEKAALPPSVPSQAPGAAPPRIRKFFPETLLSIPELLTNEKGYARLEVPLADSITTWRASIFASSLKGEMGNTTKGIRVFEDFFIDLDLPATLTQGDEISLPVAIYNYLPKTQKVNLRLKQEKWFKLLDKPEKLVSINPNEVSVVYFRLKAIDIGTHTFQATAFGSSMSDAIEREIKVEPDGKPFTTTQSDWLKGKINQSIIIPSKAIAGSGKITVTIYPGLFSQVVEGLDKILRMPSGCFEQTSSTTYPNVLVLDYLSKMKRITPEIQMKAENYINIGYQRLVTFEVQGGGFSWFGDAPANKVLTAFGVMEFKDMNAVYPIDESLIKRTQDWLVNQQEKDGSFSPDEAYLHEDSWSKIQNNNLPVTAYIVWGLLESGYPKEKLTKSIDYLKTHLEEAQDSYTLALMFNALGTYKKDDPVVKKIWQKLKKRAKTSQGLLYWDTSLSTATFSRGETAAIETTALVALGILRTQVGYKELTDVLNYLIKNKDPQGTWQSTQATILALKAFVKASEGLSQKINGEVAISINGRKIENLKVTPQNSDVYYQLDLGNYTKIGKNIIEIIPSKSLNNGKLLYQITTKYYIPWKLLLPSQPKVAEKALDIKVNYDKTQLQLRDTVKVAVTVQNLTPAELTMIVIDLGIPPGFTVDDTNFSLMVKKGKIQRYSITGRQIIVYLEKLSSKGTLTFSYEIKARFALKVQIPRSEVYEYYNPNIRTETKPQNIVVKQ